MSACTPLHYAAREGREAVVAQLLAANPNSIKAVAPKGWTALHFAVSGGHERVVTQLLAADPTLIKATGAPDSESVLSVAMRYQCARVIIAKLLAAKPDLASLPEKEQQSLIVSATSDGHEAVVRALLAVKPELIHATNFNKDSLLLLAIQSRNSNELVAELARLAPNLLRSPDWKGVMPFELAIQRYRDSATIESLQGSFTFDEVVSAHERHNKSYCSWNFTERLRPVLEKQCEALLPDVAGIVFEFLGLESVKQHKRLKH